MKNIRKLPLMHQRFGRCDGRTCGECSNLVEGKYHDKVLRKCRVYGMTHSEASDWAKSWPACGMFNQVYRGGPIMALVRHSSCKPAAVEEPIEGQLSLME